MVAIRMGLDIEELLSRAEAAHEKSRRAEALRAKAAQEAQAQGQGASGGACGGGMGSGNEPAPQRAPVSPADQSAARQKAAGNEARCRRCVEQPADPNAVRRAEPRLGLQSEQGTLRRGSRGPEVEEMQRRLNQHGARLAVDGRFGPKTDRALKDFQRRQGLAADGVHGSRTAEKLKAEPQRRPDPTSGGTRPSGTTRPDEPTRRPGQPENRTATFDKVSKAGQRDQMVTGRITVNGNTYEFRSGGFGRGNLPKGEYTISNLRNRDTRGMVKDGVGFSADMTDKYDSRVGGTRTALRIHPDGGTPGTMGCMGIVGDAATQRRFREDLRQELQRNGGRFTLRVG